MLHQQTIRFLALERSSDRPPAKWVQTHYNSHCAYAMFACHKTVGASFPNPVGLAAGFDKDGCSRCCGRASALALLN